MWMRLFVSNCTADSCFMAQSFVFRCPSADCQPFRPDRRKPDEKDARNQSWSTNALKASRGKPWVEPSCFSADIGISLSREPISKGETSPAASQYAACLVMSFIDPVTERFSALAYRTDSLTGATNRS